MSWRSRPRSRDRGKGCTRKEIPLINTRFQNLVTPPVDQYPISEPGNLASSPIDQYPISVPSFRALFIRSCSSAACSIKYRSLASKQMNKHFMLVVPSLEFHPDGRSTYSWWFDSRVFLHMIKTT